MCNKSKPLKNQIMKNTIGIILLVLGMLIGGIGLFKDRNEKRTASIIQLQQQQQPNALTLAGGFALLGGVILLFPVKRAQSLL